MRCTSVILSVFVPRHLNLYMSSLVFKSCFLSFGILFFWAPCFFAFYFYEEDSILSLNLSFVQDASFCPNTNAFSCPYLHVALSFFNGFNKLFDTWTGPTYKENLKAGNMEYNSGEWHWLYVTTGGGLIIGLLRLSSYMPARVDGLFREVRDLEVDPAHSPLIFLVSCLSLGFGASVGPEAAMGNVGGGVGTCK